MRLSVHTACDKTVSFFFSHYQNSMCVVKLETCSMRAIIAAIVALRAATRQCEQIIKTYKGPFTQRASDDVAMHAFLDAMKRYD